MVVYTDEHVYQTKLNLFEKQNCLRLVLENIWILMNSYWEKL